MKQYVCLLFITIAYSTVPMNYINHYFQHERITYVTIFGCWRNDDYKQMSKLLDSNFIAHTIIRIGPNYELKKYPKLQTFVKIRNRKHTFFLDLNCANSWEVLNMPIKYGRFDSNFDGKLKWIILSNEDIDVFVKNENTLQFRLDSDIILASFKNNTIIGYKLYHTGYNKQDGKLMYYKEHTFSTKTNILLNINKNNTFYENRKDLRGVALKTVTVITKNYTGTPESFLEERSKIGVDLLNRLNFALFKHIILMHNFRMVLNTTRIWYGNSPTGIDGGLTQLLWLKKTDICATSAIMYKEKMEVLDYISPTYYFGTCFLFRNPSAIGKIRNPFLEPFADSTWLVSVSFCVIICTCLKMSYSLHGRYILKRGERRSDHERWSSCLLNTIAAFCQQDIQIDVNYITQRILVLCTMLFSLILYNYYTSSIVSDLINSRPQAFKNLHDLVQSDMKLGAEDAPYTRRLLNISKDEDLVNLRDKKLQPPGKPEQYMKLLEGIKKVKDGDFAYHLEATTGYALVAKTFEAAEICDLKEIYFINKTWLFLLIQKNSEYKKLFSISYAKIKERGILDREIKIWRFPKPVCLSNANILQIELEQVAVAFLILLIGTAASILILLLEIRKIK